MVGRQTRVLTFSHIGQRSWLNTISTRQIHISNVRVGTTTSSLMIQFWQERKRELKVGRWVGIKSCAAPPGQPRRDRGFRNERGRGREERERVVISLPLSAKSHPDKKVPPPPPPAHQLLPVKGNNVPGMSPNLLSPVRVHSRHDPTLFSVVARCFLPSSKLVRAAIDSLSHLGGPSRQTPNPALNAFSPHTRKCACSANAPAL